MTDERYEAVIVGAGIAGLTAAWALRDRKILLLEAADRVGGRLRSEPRGPYWLNLGAHLFGGRGTLMDRLVNEWGSRRGPSRGTGWRSSSGADSWRAAARKRIPFACP